MQAKCLTKSISGERVRSTSFVSGWNKKHQFKMRANFLLLKDAHEKLMDQREILHSRYIYGTSNICNSSFNDSRPKNAAKADTLTHIETRYCIMRFYKAISTRHMIKKYNAKGIKIGGISSESRDSFVTDVWRMREVVDLLTARQQHNQRLKHLTKSPSLLLSEELTSSTRLMLHFNALKLNFLHCLIDKKCA